MEPPQFVNMSTFATAGVEVAVVLKLAIHLAVGARPTVMHRETVVTGRAL